jgi:AraC family transcriptional regulator of adaptative response/methylated-DNA-[protein]-cysteine methyltransferase
MSGTGNQQRSPEAGWWEAVRSRDARLDGAFFYAVSTSGVYCRPSCPARRPKRENVLFFRRRVEAERAGFRACLRCRPQINGRSDPAATLARQVCRYIEEHLDERVTLAALGERFGVSPFHLQRTFKATMGISPREYADACRLRSLKHGLRQGSSVTAAMYDAGYGSSSRLYERSTAQLGMTPARYRRGGQGVAIRYATADSRLGRLLLAASGSGICSIQFGDSESAVEQAIRREYPQAELRRDPVGLRSWTEALLQHLDGREPALSLPLDIQATAFQRKVWKYLMSLPYGSTRSYGQVARDVGEPRASRAVARACASNPVAIAIPCHRVVREDGGLGGYRWGLKRKQALLRLEQRRAEAGSRKNGRP